MTDKPMTESFFPKLFYVNNGQIFIGKLKSQQNGMYSIEKAQILHILPNQNGTFGIQMVPVTYPLFDHKETVDLNASLVVFIVSLTKLNQAHIQLIDEYMKLTSNLLTNTNAMPIQGFRQ